MCKKLILEVEQHKCKIHHVVKRFGQKKNIDFNETLLLDVKYCTKLCFMTTMWDVKFEWLDVKIILLYKILNEEM